MAVQLTLSIYAQSGPTLTEEVQMLALTWGVRTGASIHADASAAITARHFADWADRTLSASERRRVEAYFRGVLRQRIISGSDVDAREARSRLIARSIERDLVQAGWGQAQAEHQARAATGIALSA